MIADLAMQRALDRFHQNGAAGLDDEDRTLAALWGFESKVANGGLADFFRSPFGDLAAFAPAALRNIGAEPLAQIATEANALFGLQGVPSGRAQRKRALAAFTADQQQVLAKLDARYFGFDLDLDDMIAAFISARRRDR